MTVRVVIIPCHWNHVHLILEASMPQLLRPSRCFFVFLWLVSRLHGGQWSPWLLRENQRRGCQTVSALKELRTICFTSSFADCKEKSGEMLAGEAKKVRVSPGTQVSFRAVSTRPCIFPCHWQETAQWYPSICSINRHFLGCSILYVLYNNIVASSNFLPQHSSQTEEWKIPIPSFSFPVLWLSPRKTWIESKKKKKKKKGGMFESLFFALCNFCIWGEKNPVPISREDSGFLCPRWKSPLFLHPVSSQI